MPGSAPCLGGLLRGGQKFGNGDRRAASQLCDAFYLLRDAAVAGRGLDGDALLAGMPLVGPRFAPAATFGSVLAGHDHGVPGYYRDQQYVASCSCFVYSGPKRPFS